MAFCCLKTFRVMLAGEVATVAYGRSEGRMEQNREDKNRTVGEKKRIEREGTREKGNRNRKEQSWATLAGLYVGEARRATGSTRTL